MQLSLLHEKEILAAVKDRPAATFHVGSVTAGKICLSIVDTFQARFKSKTDMIYKVWSLTSTDRRVPIPKHSATGGWCQTADTVQVATVQCMPTPYDLLRFTYHTWAQYSTAILSQLSNTSEQIKRFAHASFYSKQSSYNITAFRISRNLHALQQV